MWRSWIPTKGTRWPKELCLVIGRRTHYELRTAYVDHLTDHHKNTSQDALKLHSKYLVDLPYGYTDLTGVVIGEGDFLYCVVSYTRKTRLPHVAVTQLFWCHVDRPEWRESSCIGYLSAVWRRFSLTVCKGHLYFIGGCTATRIPSRHLYSLQLETSSDGKEIINRPWIEMRSMKAARSGHSATV